MNLKQPQQQILPGILVFIVVLVYFYPKIAATEKYFPLYPGIDTIYPPHFSEHNFNLISEGMSRTEVLELLGEPSYRGNYPPPDVLPKGYSYHATNLIWGYGIDGGCRGWCDLAWVGYFIDFDSESSNAKVIQTRRDVFFD
ncbi:MAG: hypothetical protein AB1861_23185 [Cyanobacteriota bacterium]